MPDPEDFRLEKRYGLTTPVGPDGKKLVGAKSSPPSSRVWFWASILVAASVFGLVAFWLYRRRNRGAPSPARSASPIASPR